MIESAGELSENCCFYAVLAVVSRPQSLQKLWHKFLDKRTDVEYRARVILLIVARFSQFLVSIANQSQRVFPEFRRFSLFKYSSSGPVIVPEFPASLPLVSQSIAKLILEGEYE